MIELSESAFLTASIGAMAIGLLLAFIPIMPGTMIVWIIGMVAAVLDQFQHITPTAAVIMTAIMLLGVSSDFWLPALGVKTGGMSCLAAVGSLIGGLLGTFFIPVPLAGTLIGTALGAGVVEWARLRRVQGALTAGRSAAKLFVIGYVVELATSIAIFVTFVVSIATTT